MFYLKRSKRNSKKRDKEDQDTQLKQEDQLLKSVEVRYNYEHSQELTPDISPSENKSKVNGMSDKIIAGIVLGIISNIPKQIIDFILYRLEFSQFFCWHVTGGIIISSKWLETYNGILIGAFMDAFIAGFLGVLLIYFLYIFGQERYLFIKGVLFSILIWIFLCMIIIDLRVSMYATLTDPRHAYHSFIVHTIWGIAMSYLVVKYAQPTVIPSAWNKIKKYIH